MRVLETVLYARDVDAAAAFYRDVLGARPVGGSAGKEAFLAVGDAMLLLFDPDATRRGGGLPPHGADPGGHVAFEVDDLAPWRGRLAAAGVAIEREHRWPHGPASLYFRDPAGNLVELASPGLWRV